jgi:hypothetical protein
MVSTARAVPVMIGGAKPRAFPPKPLGFTELLPPTAASSVPTSVVRRENTMSRVTRANRVDPLTWISSIRREEESTSGTDSGNNSRYGSQSRPPSRIVEGVLLNDLSSESIRRRSASRDQGENGYDLRNE